MTTLRVERARPGWGFGLCWLVATTVGIAVGAAVGFPTLFFLGISMWFKDANTAIAVLFVGFVLLGAAVGAMVGFPQRFVVRRYVAGAWMRTSVLAYGIGMALGAASADVGTHSPLDVLWTAIITAIVIGTVVGSLQWLVLRRHVARAGWWVPANAVGLAAGGVLSFTLSSAVASLPMTGDWLVRVFLTPLILAAIGGIGYAVITGTALVWLLRQTRSEIQTGTMESHALKGTS